MLHSFKLSSNLAEFLKGTVVCFVQVESKTAIKKLLKIPFFIMTSLPYPYQCHGIVSQYRLLSECAGRFDWQLYLF